MSSKSLDFTTTLPNLQVKLQRGQVSNSTALKDPEVEVLALGLLPAREGDEGADPTTGTAQAAVRYQADLAQLVDSYENKGEAGQVSVVHLPIGLAQWQEELPWAKLPKTIAFVGIGSGSTADLRKAGAALRRCVPKAKKVLSSVTEGLGPEQVGAFVEGFALPIPVKRTEGEYDSELVLLGNQSQVAQQVLTGVQATHLARALTNTVSNLKNPQWFVDKAKELAQKRPITVTHLNEAQLEKQGFGGLIAVGSGSATPPQFITLDYHPQGAKKHIAVVGKGITFDTGGISLKPRMSMINMKTDMAGGAVALATVLAAADQELPHRITAVIPLAENAFSGSSYRPGDVVTVYDGTTVEIANTDAEGRMVLADALGYTVKNLKPDIIIDLATLTGAITLGLGRGHAGFYTNTDDLVSGLQEAGDRTGELVWRMPLPEDYRPALDSRVADIGHIESPDSPIRGGGSITAALFLQHFVGQTPWIHLDIAGVGRSEKDAGVLTPGATGYGARLLLDWLAAL